MKARRAAALAVAALALASGCEGRHEAPGEVTPAPLPEAVVRDRDARQTIPERAYSQISQILFGDLHVHTTFSPDAFVMSLPMLGGVGSHPPADACDFARFCSALDFWSINDHAEGVTPRHWRESAEAIRQCNDVAGDEGSPDLVSFLGWEWTQVGDHPGNHYGHKNVVLLETAPDRIPRRPIAAPRAEMRVPLLPWVGRVLLPLVQFSQRQRYFDYDLYREENEAVPECPTGVDTRELPDDCHEVAADPAALFEKLGQWGLESLVIPHGTSWGLMTPPGSSLDRQLEGAQHDPGRQRLFEVYSGHGSAEEYRPYRAAVGAGVGSARDEGALACPVPREGHLTCCWRAGEIIAGRCEAAGAGDCEARAAEARRNYVAAGVAGHWTVPGSRVEDWLDCDQCRDCFNPAYSHRPGGSAQYALAVARRGADGSPRRFRFGLIGSSDTHEARAGNGYKEFARLRLTEAAGPRGPAVRFVGDRRDPDPRSEAVVLTELSLGSRRYTERGASFFLTGGLAAVHARGRDRHAIWGALRRREVYGTSGDRILLWFDLLNAPGGPAPMGSEVSLSAAPRFRVTAAGAFEQRPGCPEHVTRALAPERLAKLCLGECHNPADRRRLVTRIEVVRIRPQQDPDEPVEGLVEDPWLVLPCAPDAAGCAVEFEDPTFVAAGREALYYVRAIQEPTPAVNADGVRCTRDAQGTCVELDPCYGDARTPASDDCLAQNEERAWSSPIFVGLAPATAHTNPMESRP